MSCVVSEVFEHKKKQMGTDYETDCDFSYNTSQELKTYGLDDKFHVEGTYYSAMQGTVRTSIQLSVSEAKRLKRQLEEFIFQNS